MKRTTLGVILPITVGLVHCASQPEPQPAPPPAAAASQPSEAASAPAGGDEMKAAEAEPQVDMTAPGAYSEAEFAKLHEMKEGENIPTKGEMIDIKGSKAYLSLPEGATAPLPAVLIVHEWWGLNDNIKLWADRLAKEGYAALAVDLYGGQVAANADEAGVMMKKVDQKKARAVLKNAYAFMGKDARIKAKKRGVIGWCFGGSWALQVAMSEPTLTAAVVYYGELVKEPKKLKSIKAKLLGIFANKDQWITPEQVTEFEAALGKAGVKAQILRYDADHAFGNPSNKERYDRTAAAAAWEEARKFIEANLKS